jgi:TolB-like protein
MGGLLAYLGRAQEGITWIERASRLNPFPPQAYTSFYGMILFAARGYAESIAAFNRILVGTSNWEVMYLVAGNAYLGRLEEARTLINTWAKLHPDISLLAFAAKEPFKQPADLDHLLEGLRIAAASSPKPSIAVLPFTNMTSDPEQQYLSDGITEDIITELSRYREMVVIARNSSFLYRDRSTEMRWVGRGLGAEYLVEGSLRKAGDRIRVTAQLIEAVTGSQIWAERYETDLKDIFAIQDEVAQTIAATLVEASTSLSPSNLRSIRESRSASNRNRKLQQTPAQSRLSCKIDYSLKPACPSVPAISKFFTGDYLPDGR